MVQRRCAHVPAPHAETRAALPCWKADPSTTTVCGVELGMAGEGGTWPQVPGGSREQQVPGRGAGSITSQVGGNG